MNVREKSYSTKYHAIRARQPKEAARRKEYSREWRRKNPARIRLLKQKDHYKRTYGLSLEDIAKGLRRLRYKCTLCQRVKKRFGVDHDHKTGELRGLLCFGCNMALGYIENKRWLVRALKYLRGDRPSTFQKD